MTENTRANRRAKNLCRLLGGAVIAALLSAGLVTVPQTEAQALQIDMPSWEDVQKAKNDEAAAAGQIEKTEKLLAQLELDLEAKRNSANDLAAAFKVADDELQVAAKRTELLEGEAAKSEVKAAEAAEQAASIVSQMYRSGGIDRNVELFLETDESTADQLLQRLASMSKAAERNSTVAGEAERAMNSAATLGKQAEVARTERDKLRTVAEENKIAAAAAAEEARVDLIEQEDAKQELEAQLAALKDKTVKTVAEYEEGLRQIELARQEELRRQEEERRRLEEERRKQEEEAAANGGGGGGGSTGGGGGGGGTAPSGAWMVPVSGYWISDVWGAGRNHLGIDLAVGAWTPIRAAGSGVVTFSGWWPYCGGYQVEITHPDGLKTWYSHQVQPPIVGLGQHVSVGQTIGYVGSTGCSSGAHLHFATLAGGYNFVEPQSTMARRGVYF